MELTHRERLILVEVVLDAWVRVVKDEIERDLETFDELDLWKKFWLSAYWSKYMLRTIASRNAFPKPTSWEAEFELIHEIFGKALELPISALEPDIAARLDWYKRRIGKDFERQLRSRLDMHAITSPIEQVFMMEWMFARLNERFGVRLKPQKAVKTSKGEYRVDFMVTQAGTTGPKLEIAIELDGHEFHEESKEQVAKDKSRERAIVSAGPTVLRFSGSEILFRTRQCVEEVAEFLASGTSQD